MTTGQSGVNKAFVVALESGDSALKKLCIEEKVSGACALSGQDARPLRPLPILQGASSLEQVRLLALTSSREPHFFIFGDGPWRKVEGQAAKYVDHHMIQIDLFKLDPKKEYELVVIGQNGDLLDRRKFRTLDSKKKRARVALVSCTDDSYGDIQKKIWPELLAQNPDVILMIGDNVYADKPHRISSADQISKRYIDTWLSLAVFKANPLVPILATWDDHDYGKNDGDRTFVLKNESAQIFNNFFGRTQPVPDFEKGPGVSSWWSAFGVQFALLDGRSFRSPNKTDLPDETHFGEDQEKLIKERLTSAKTPVFLVSGDQFFGGYHSFESYEGSHPKSFKMQLAEWRKASKTPVVFLSGDRHLTEIIKVPSQHLGYGTFEITSSALHARVFPDAFSRFPSPMQLVGRAGEYNYSMIEIVEATRKRLRLDVKSFGLDKKLIYQESLTVKRP